tara:strand:- start:203 stop:718 length:516 start_codon:yes stop_codon:yes gene_type:complete
MRVSQSPKSWIALFLAVLMLLSVIFRNEVFFLGQSYFWGADKIVFENVEVSAVEELLVYWEEGDFGSRAYGIIPIDNSEYPPMLSVRLMTSGRIVTFQTLSRTEFENSNSLISKFRLGEIVNDDVEIISIDGRQVIRVNSIDSVSWTIPELSIYLSVDSKQSELPLMLKKI